MLTAVQTIIVDIYILTCRAVHLTLAVAVLGSLLGGVQLFAMIKMLGLQLVDIERQFEHRANIDLEQQRNIWAAYQVSCSGGFDFTLQK